MDASTIGVLGKGLLYGVGGFAGLVLLLRIYNTVVRGADPKGKSLSKWSRQVEFSTGQLSAMRSLSQWYKSGRKPGASPVQRLSATEVSDLLRKGELAFLPGKFRVKNEEQARNKLKEELMRIGMDEIESQIVVGMKFGKLGAANDLIE